MSDSRFSLYSCNLAPPSPTAEIDFPSLNGHRWSPNATKSPFTAAGSIDLLTQGLVAANPMHEFDSVDLLTTLTNIDPVAGLNCGQGGTFRRQLRADNDDFVAGTDSGSHVIWSSSKGFACIKEIGVRQDDEDGAKGSVMYQPLSSDGLTAPETIALGAINGAPTPAYVSRYFQGPVAIGGTRVQGIEGFSIDFGKRYSSKRFGGQVFPLCGSIVDRKPQFKFTTSASNLNVTLNSFLNQGTVDLYLVREDVTTSNGRVALGTGAHIKISGTAEYSASEDSVVENDDSTVTFACDVIGTVSMSTTSTITVF